MTCISLKGFSIQGWREERFFWPQLWVLGAFSEGLGLQLLALVFSRAQSLERIDGLWPRAPSLKWLLAFRGEGLRFFGFKVARVFLGFFFPHVEGLGFLGCLGFFRV